MAKYLKLFKTLQERESACFDASNTPNVNLCDEDGSVIYIKFVEGEQSVPETVWYYQGEVVKKELIEGEFTSAYNSSVLFDTCIIGTSVTSIDGGVFYCHSGLTSVTIPNSVISIGSSAFYYCSGLESITISNSVTSVGDEIFCGCTSLEEIIYSGTVEEFKTLFQMSYNGFGDVPLDCTIICSDDIIHLADIIDDMSTPGGGDSGSGSGSSSGSGSN